MLQQKYHLTDFIIWMSVTHCSATQDPAVTQIDYASLSFSGFLSFKLVWSHLSLHLVKALAFHLLGSL